tara:strand:+ start:2435 stop:4270 length:1836 start_codon:yes stop_codon:yes gene_type:complete
MNNLLGDFCYDKPFAFIYSPQHDVENMRYYTGELSSHYDTNCTTKQGKSIVILPNCFLDQKDKLTSPILSLQVEQEHQIPISQFISKIKTREIGVKDPHFDLDDQSFKSIVKQVIHDAIGQGEGSNFVLHRNLITRIIDFEPELLLTLYANLLRLEKSAYWVFFVSTGNEYFIGASPELHVTQVNEEIMMNPISGTIDYSSDIDGFCKFLSCPKEVKELAMVTDEELKMMSKVCKYGAQVSDLQLHYMKYVVHTSYRLTGKTDYTFSKILRETLPNPALMGSPIENAVHISQKYQGNNRGYYGGVLSLIENKEQSQTFDSCLMIRTASISTAGQIKVPVGATITQNSSPDDETYETYCKSLGLLSALMNRKRIKTKSIHDVNYEPYLDKLNTLIQERKKDFSNFWNEDSELRSKKYIREDYCSKKVFIIDCGDQFTYMLKNLFEALGFYVQVKSVLDIHHHQDLDVFDLVVCGPGPGNPSDMNNKSIHRMHQIISYLLKQNKKFLAECMSHQILSLQLGLKLKRLSVPNQGIQKKINIRDIKYDVAFYNTFCSIYEENFNNHKHLSMQIDHENNQVNTLYSKNFRSFQYHVESFLTIKNISILEIFLKDFL